MSEKDSIDITHLSKLTKKVTSELRGIGIPVSDNIDKTVINKRTKRRLGACLSHISSTGKKSFTIEVSARALVLDEQIVKSIIAHELLHTCAGCFNHGKKWKEYGERTKSLLGYEIKRTMKVGESSMDLLREKENYRYTVVCKTCGQKFLRKRKCPLVEHPEKYRCGKCGGKLKLM